jgi:hypothetical protein
VPHELTKLLLASELRLRSRCNPLTRAYVAHASCSSLMRMPRSCLPCAQIVWWCCSGCCRRAKAAELMLSPDLALTVSLSVSVPVCRSLVCNFADSSQDKRDCLRPKNWPEAKTN